MITFITGNFGKSLVGTGLAKQMMSYDGRRPYVFHEGASQDQIKEKQKDHSEVIICWPDQIPEGMEHHVHIHIERVKDLVKAA